MNLDEQLEILDIADRALKEEIRKSREYIDLLKTQEDNINDYLALSVVKLESKIDKLSDQRFNITLWRKYLINNP